MIITDIYDGNMANCQTVRGNKTNKDQNDNKKQTNKQAIKTKNRTTNNNKTGGGGGGWKNKQLTEWSSDVVTIIDREVLLCVKSFIPFSWIDRVWDVPSLRRRVHVENMNKCPAAAVKLTLLLAEINVPAGKRQQVGQNLHTRYHTQARAPRPLSE